MTRIKGREARVGVSRAMCCDDGLVNGGRDAVSQWKVWVLGSI